MLFNDDSVDAEKCLWVQLRSLSHRWAAEGGRGWRGEGKLGILMSGQF